MAQRRECLNWQEGLLALLTSAYSSSCSASPGLMQKKGGLDRPTLPRRPTEELLSLGPRVGRAQWRTGTHNVTPAWFTCLTTASASRDGAAGVGRRGGFRDKIRHNSGLKRLELMLGRKAFVQLKGKQKQKEHKSGGERKQGKRKSLRLFKLELNMNYLEILLK